MSLSTCTKCGGHIQLGPEASNRCEKCGAGVFMSIDSSKQPPPDPVTPERLAFNLKVRVQSMRLINDDDCNRARDICDGIDALMACLSEYEQDRKRLKSERNDWQQKYFDFVQKTEVQGYEAANDFKKLAKWADWGADEEKWPPGGCIVDGILAYVAKLQAANTQMRDAMRDQSLVMCETCKRGYSPKEGCLICKAEAKGVIEGMKISIELCDTARKQIGERGNGHYARLCMTKIADGMAALKAGGSCHSS